MDQFLARARVVLSAVVTYLALAGVVVAIVLGELANYVDEPTVAWVVRILGGVATVLTVASLIIRRVTEVLPEQRGILPPPPPPNDGGAAVNRAEIDPDSWVGLRWRDTGRVDAETILVTVAVVVLVLVVVALL